MFDSSVLRILFVSKSADVAGGWTELHNDEHHLYCSSDIIW